MLVICQVMKVNIPVWIRIWSRRWLRVRNILPHTSQRNLKRLLPIWITECCFRRLERENVLLQTSQWWTELSDESFCSIAIKWYRKLLQMLSRQITFNVLIFAHTHTAKVLTEWSIVNEFSETSFFWVSSRTLTDGTLTEGEQNRMNREWILNGYGTDSEMDKEQKWEHVWNSNRMHFVKRSLLGFFW